MLLLPFTLRAPLVAWDASSGADGYNVFWSEISHSYDFVQDVGNVTSNRLVGLLPGRTYFIAVNAYRNAAESDLSDEISFTVPSTNSILTIYSAGDPVMGPWFKEVAVTNRATGQRFFKWTLGFETNTPLNK